ncbi:MAG: hypothetical protein ACN6PR_14410 [Achromobacter sp.]
MSGYIFEKCSLIFLSSIGIGYSTGGQQNGWTVELGTSVGRGNANGRDGIKMSDCIFDNCSLTPFLSESPEADA